MPDSHPENTSIPSQRDCSEIRPFARTRLFWPVADPAAVAGTREEHLAAFRAARDELDARIEAWLTELRVESRTAS